MILTSADYNVFFRITMQNMAAGCFVLALVWTDGPIDEWISMFNSLCNSLYFVFVNTGRANKLVFMALQIMDSLNVQ